MAVTPAQAPPKQAAISADTLEKYIPKNILFVQGKSIMLSESQPELDRLAGFLLRNPALQLSIEGHTDNHGDSAKNMILSEERAQVVSAYLTGQRRSRPTDQRQRLWRYAPSAENSHRQCQKQESGV